MGLPENGKLETGNGEPFSIKVLYVANREETDQGAERGQGGDP